MITREQVNSLQPGQTLYHYTNGSDGKPLRAKVNGQPQTWKREPQRFRVPMKHGIKYTFQLRPEIAHEWFADEQEAANSKTPPHIKKGP